MNILLLRGFNNYFNRIVKKHDALADYRNGSNSYLDLASINFNPNDGISTVLVIGSTNQQESNLPLNWENNGTPDYLICYENEGTPATAVIKSRWFVLESERTRNGQYRITLKRDVIADNYDAVNNCTAYIEKGNIEPGSPLLFNKEGLAVNQIKQQEILLKDKTKVPWIVAYIAKNAEVNTPITINYDPAEKDYIELSATTIQDWSYYQYSTSKFYGPITVSKYRINWQSGTGDSWHYGHFKTVFDIYGNVSYGRITNDDWSYVLRANDTSSNAMTSVSNALSLAWNNIGPSVFEQAVQDHYGAHTNYEISTFLDYNGKIVKTQDGKYYLIRVFSVAGLNLNDSTVSNFNSSSPLFTRVKQAVVNSGQFNGSYNTPNSASFFLTASASAYSMSYEQIEGKTVKAKISENRRKTTDALYDIICLPYGDLNVYDKDDDSLVLSTNKEISMAAINALTKELGGGTAQSAVYDVQLLPYCPLQSSIELQYDHFVIDTTEAGTAFDYIVDESTEPDSNVGLVLYVPQSSFTFNITQQLNIDRYEIISGFESISAPFLVTRGKEYTFETFNTTLTNIGLDEQGSYSMSTPRGPAGTPFYGDGIRIRKINKITGRIIDEYNCAKLEIQLNTGNVDNAVSTYVTDRSGITLNLKETITTDEYANNDFYLSWIVEARNLTSSAPALRVIIPDLCGIAIKEAAYTEQYAVKLNNECKLYRLVSPNYQGTFEFSVAKNLGVDEFNVDCTYKPFNPYIHVNPNFKNLYGQDFNDSRGLICNGDFSFGMVSDAFANYELQNKNYQAIFNRQIQNMDVNYDIARTEAGWQIAAGTVSGAASGAMTGALSGGGAYGAAAGAIVGGATSLIGGITDLQNLKKRQDEAKSFAADMYTLSLQNVQALPNSLTRCAALTYNNKLFPFIEIYGCTPEEEAAFIQKLRYDGMTVNIIGRLGDYKGGLVRGDIIRYQPTDLKDDAHVANQIYAEIKKGVYM